MLDIFIQNGYWFMLIQVLVTLLVFPIHNFKRLMTTITSYSKAYYPDAKSEVEEYTKRKLKPLITVVGLCFVIGIIIVLHALVNVEELLSWDNQAGLVVLCVIGFIPVFCVTLLQKGIFNIFKQHAGSIRTASLTPRKWQKYFPLPLVILVVTGQVAFISTVVYFSQHPFQGFAGYSNILGLLALDAVFIAVCYTILNNNRMASIKDISQREAIKSKAIKINLAVWIIAVFHVSVSIWLAGLELREYSLFFQSIYIHVLLFLTAFSLAPAKLAGGAHEAH